MSSAASLTAAMRPLLILDHDTHNFSNESSK
jgi:hypothetical protein